MPLAEVRSTDDLAMIEAIEALTKAGIEVRRPPNNAHQLKVSPSLSYYPGRETIVADGEPSARPQRGLAALLTYLDGEPDATLRHPA